MNRSRIFAIASYLLIASLIACSKGEKSPQATQPKEGHYKNFVKLSARLLPEEPTVADDLQVIFTGTGNVKYRWDRNGQAIDGENGAILTKKHFSRGDLITAHIYTDTQDDVASTSINNASPQVTSVSVGPENICRGVDIAASPKGFDADGDPVSYSFRWRINGQELPVDTAVLSGNLFKSGDQVSLKVTPRDNYDAGKEYATQAFTVPNCAPYFTSTPPTAFDGKLYIYEAKAMDPDGDPVTYSLVSAPQGMTIDRNTGKIEWNVARQTKKYDIDIEAKDDKGLANIQKYTLSINIL